MLWIRAGWLRIIGIGFMRIFRSTGPIGVRSDSRGRFLCAAVAAGDEPGTMAALAAGPAQIDVVVDGIEAVIPVNWNGPRQTVISGPRAAVARDPLRLVHVAPYEPLFRELAHRGFDWHASNVPSKPTERAQPGRSARPLGKIDWIFTRGLRVSAPAILPALAMDGTTVSDHDCLLVTVEADW